MTTGALLNDGALEADGPVGAPHQTSWGEDTDLAVVADHAPRVARGLASWKVLALTDAAGSLLIIAAVALSAGRIAGPAGRTWAQNLVLVGVTWGSLLVAFAAKRLYPRARRHLTSVNSASLAPLVEAIVTTLLVVLSADALAGGRLHRALPPAVVLLTFTACLVLLPALRSVAVAAHARRGRVNARVLVIGTGTVASDIAARLRRCSQVELVGFVDDDPVDGVPVAGVVGSIGLVTGGLAVATGHHDDAPRGARGTVAGGAPVHEPPLLGRLDALVDLCEQHDISRVVVAFSRSRVDAATAQLRRLDHRIAIDVVPRYFELTGWDASVGDLSGLPVVNVHDGPAHVLERAAKRALDVLVASVGLLVLSPVLALLALVVKLTSSGPAFFTQTRLGRGRERFRIIKLRTMFDAERGGEGNDPDAVLGIHNHGESRRPGTFDGSRVTPLGRFLRRSGLDEIPQLLNVLSGRMSLVGPRPFIPAECRELPEWSDPRFEVRPGMTGLWQVCGQHHLRFEELCRLDVLYVSRWSLGADLRILARTPARLLRGGGDGRALAD